MVFKRKKDPVQACRWPGSFVLFLLVRLGREDSLDLQVQVDPLGDHDTAALDRRVPGHAEVGAVDMSRGGEPGAGAAVGVRTEPVGLELERDAAGDALQR